MLRTEFNKGLEAENLGDYHTAKVHFDQVDVLAERYSHNVWGTLQKMNDVRQLGELVTSKLKIFELPKNLDEIKARAREKSKLADRIDKTRSDADALFETADALRFRLHLGQGSELSRAFEDLQKALVPFYVLKNEDWTKLDHTLPLLNPPRRERLLTEVNELLFLWMVRIDERWTRPPTLVTRRLLSRIERPSKRP